MSHFIPDYSLFCDASVSPQSQVALGAHLILNQSKMQEARALSHEQLQSWALRSICFFSQTTGKSTEAELRNFLQALYKIPTTSKVRVYTDCQSLCDLLGARRQKLEKKQFKNSKGEDLAHKELYQSIFKTVDQYKIEIKKVKGHQPKKKRKTKEEEIFSVVDKISRSQLRLQALKSKK